MSSSFSHLDPLVTVPYSTRIKDDMILSFVKVDTIEQALTQYESSTEKNIKVIQDVPKNLEQVMKVYNENVNYINVACKNFKKFQFPTFAQYQDTFGYTSDHPNAKIEYENEKAKETQHYNQKLEEVTQLGQAGLLHKALKQKIEEVFERTSAQIVVLTAFPTLVDVVEPDAERLMLFYPSLRKPKEAKSSEASTSSTSSKSTPPSVPTTPDPSIRSTIGLGLEAVERPFHRGPLPKLDRIPNFVPTTISWPLVRDLAIGICHEPSWGEKPVAFERARTGDFIGQIPENKLFKFVIINASQNEISAWEEGGNRCLTAESPALVLNATHIQFA